MSIFKVRFYIIDSKSNRITMQNTEFKKYLWSLNVDLLDIVLIGDDRAFLCETDWFTFRRFKESHSIFDIVNVKKIHSKKVLNFINRGGKHLR